MRSPMSHERLPRFARATPDDSQPLLRMGTGSLGGKAAGLLTLRDLLHELRRCSDCEGFDVGIPRAVVVCSDLFDAFVERNRLSGLLEREASDREIAAAFLRGDLPVEMLGDLRALGAALPGPLALRSSSLLEDALYEPFAGVYATKMIPNDHPSPDLRFRKLCDGLKFVWASTYFADARAYLRATRHRSSQEHMAVLVQEVVGQAHGARFYPELSGVARSFNYYPTGGASAADGVVNLALGLGKTIVDGGRSWTFSPARPQAAPPYNSLRDLLHQTQSSFWALRLGPLSEPDPLCEGEFLVQAGLAEAEADGTLRHLASTYDPVSDRVRRGLACAGPRLLDFAPLLVLQEYPLNALLRRLLDLAQQAFGGPVEIEFAARFPKQFGAPARFGLLQVRAMAVSDQQVSLSSADLASPRALVSSSNVMGNGADDSLCDIVYLDRHQFEPRHSPAAAAALEQINRHLLEAGRRFLLLGFGRWGSSDPWLGVPVTWSQISQAGAIVEAQLPKRLVDLSQGSHFFHNINAFRVPYFSVPPGEGIDWDWLEAQPAAAIGPFVRHLHLPAPLRLRVDGRSGQGVVLR